MKDKFYFIYKTTNLKNEKFYIGVHETYNIHDGYLGSGKRFRNSLYYHGKENFKREILEFFDNSESMYNKEKEIVNEDLLKNPKCLNIGIGGHGGFSKADCIRGGRTTGLIHKNKMINDVEYKKRIRKIASDKLKKMWRDGLMLSEWRDWTGKSHSEESKKKMSESKKGIGVGKSNSQYGTHWITDNIVNKKIKSGDEIPNGYHTGRTI